ncbi:hypothetical protein evm_007396 [Chilo suppressalis]|nr:hypothetical protein evm_007396 [Chilo suppressalis]
MHVTDLPLEKAQEPDEEAYQPVQAENAMPPSQDHTKTRKHTLTFAEGTQSTEVSSSQNNNSYREALSQPGYELTHRQKLLWLQKRRGTGLWAQCDDCNQWRHLPHIVDSHELPTKWYCSMNPDKSAADCSVPEVPIKIRDEEDLIHSEWSAGSVVWARLAGWPWWPAMVDDCPDTEQFYWLDGFSDIPTHYNVVFFDAFEATRAWISPGNLKAYTSNAKPLKNGTKIRRYKKRMEVALKQAEDAYMLPLANRLNKYSFINRYKGTIGKPKKLSKDTIKKFKKQIRNDLLVDLADESDTESIESSDSETNTKVQSHKRKNVIIVGSSKKTKSDDCEIQNESNIHVVGKDIPPLVDSHSGNCEIQTFTEENNNADIGSNYTDAIFKQPNSMAVQYSSTPAFDTMNIDNDSSKTYVPGSDTGAESAEISQTKSLLQDLEVRITSPRSDDFDF